MESFLPLSGFQLPFQQRLSRLYNDTKKSSDFVKEPVQNEEDPEIKALHRKLRIQKDRLVSWGLEWSDPTQSAEIDESLSKAGLSEVVGSIMSTIKDILAEAEPLWLSSKHLAEGGSRPSPDSKRAMVPWDKARFEDLVRDLTSSIDTLFDLSRTRTMGAVPRRPSKTPQKMASSIGDSRQFGGPTRFQTPHVIRPQDLAHLRAKQGSAGTPLREVVFMSKTAYSELNQGSTTKEPWAPLLLEYVTFDSIYSVTGIMPPMSRFEKLSAGLQQEPQRSPGVWTGLPRLLGYFEDMENSRFGLVYRFPPSFNAVSFERLTQNPHYNLPTLGDMLRKPELEPKLEAKFRLAHNLTNTVFDMHTRGITHGNLVPDNVSFCDTVQSGPTVTSGDADVRRPLLSSFDVFPEDAATETSLSRHPMDPRNSKNSPLPKNTDERVLELYSLAMILLSIGMWAPLENFIKDAATNSVPDSLLEALSQKCGSLFMKAVHACWSAVDNERRGECTGEALLSAVQMRVTRFLETCCILDGVSGLEDQLNQELQQPQRAMPEQVALPQTPVTSSKEFKDVKSPVAIASPPPQSAVNDLPEELIPRVEPERPEVAEAEAEGKMSRAAQRLLQITDLQLDTLEQSENKPDRIKLYPNVPLPPDAVEKWNTILMPQINHALRQFYKKHPESVEISLESVGPSPAHTKPTVLVVCSSVGKVRAILKKRVGDLFDNSTGFSIKVCRGHVLRSRRWSWDVFRSMANRSQVGAPIGKAADDSEVEAINPEFQERPDSGASIGAWIGDRHLPPVSFGGLLMVDDRMYGMTVHHMLDDPERDFGNEETARSSAIPGRDWFSQSTTPSSEDDDDDFAYELSDTESEPYSESDITSDWGDDDDDEDEFEPGDIPGIEPGCGDGYVVTQPALDDVEEGFYPSAETEDEDHLDTFSLGEVYASSGIRRKASGGMVHEVDWALFEFASERCPRDNYMPKASGAGSKRRPKSQSKGDKPPLLPTKVTPFTSLPGLEVQCMARTSGLQTGRILPALTSVKIYGRASPSHTYQIASTNPPSASEPGDTVPIGIPGDSGAWIVDRHNGQLCGHVLAWSQRKQVAYICPMDVLLADIAQTLEASEIRLPGGEVVVSQGDKASVALPEGTEAALERSRSTPGAAHASKLQAAPQLVEALNTFKSASDTSLYSLGQSGQASPGPARMTSSGDVGILARTMNDLRVDRGIGVSV